jgi:hypothetical protein
VARGVCGRLATFSFRWGLACLGCSALMARVNPRLCAFWRQLLNRLLDVFCEMTRKSRGSLTRFARYSVTCRRILGFIRT